MNLEGKKIWVKSASEAIKVIRIAKEMNPKYKNFGDNNIGCAYYFYKGHMSFGGSSIDFQTMTDSSIRESESGEWFNNHDNEEITFKDLIGINFKIVKKG
tara:strand:- start:48019 stop:48318 length:300 start_codon:yes stop_codon:yes gene_type:complete